MHVCIFLSNTHTHVEMHALSITLLTATGGAPWRQDVIPMLMVTSKSDLLHVENMREWRPMCFLKHQTVFKFKENSFFTSHLILITNSSGLILEKLLYTYPHVTLMYLHARIHYLWRGKLTKHQQTWCIHTSQNNHSHLKQK